MQKRDSIWMMSVSRFMFPSAHQKLPWWAFHFGLNGHFIIMIALTSKLNIHSPSDMKQLQQKKVVHICEVTPAALSGVMQRVSWWTDELTHDAWADLLHWWETDELRLSQHSIKWQNILYLLSDLWTKSPVTTLWYVLWRCQKRLLSRVRLWRTVTGWED